MAPIRTIDAHVAGQVVRLVTEGFTPPAGGTMEVRRQRAGRLADVVRRVVLLEPRGHLDQSAVVLTEPVHPGSHAGLLFMDAGGFPRLSLLGAMAAASVARRRGLLVTARAEEPLVFDTPAGVIRVDARADGAVACVGLPSFVVSAGVEVSVPGRLVRADVAFGGAFHAVVDAEGAGVPLGHAHIGDLRRMGAQIREVIESRMAMTHPLDGHDQGLRGVVFTAPPQGASADLRMVTVYATGAVSRAPGGTAASAVLAVLSAMGLVDVGQSFAPEGLAGTLLRADLAAVTRVGDLAAIVPSIEGGVWLIGDQSLVVEPGDPLAADLRR